MLSDVTFFVLLYCANLLMAQAHRELKEDVIRLPFFVSSSSRKYFDHIVVGLD